MLPLEKPPTMSPLLKTLTENKIREIAGRYTGNRPFQVRSSKARVDPDDPDRVIIDVEFMPVLDHITVDFTIDEPTMTTFEGVQPGEQCWISLTEGFGWYTAQVGPRAESLATATTMHLGEERVLTLRDLRSQMPGRTPETKLWYDIYDRRLAEGNQRDPFSGSDTFQYENRTLKVWVKCEDETVYVCTCHVYDIEGKTFDGAQRVVLIGGHPLVSNSSLTNGMFDDMSVPAWATNALSANQNSVSDMQSTPRKRSNVFADYFRQAAKSRLYQTVFGPPKLERQDQRVKTTE